MTLFSKKVSAMLLGGLIITTIFTLSGCLEGSGGSSPLMQRMAAYFENPTPSDTEIFATYLKRKEPASQGLSIGGFTAGMIQLPQVTREALGQVEVPNVILAAMKGNVSATLLKDFFASRPGSPWNPKHLGAASIAAKEPWGVVAHSKGSDASLWFTLYNTDDNQLLVNISSNKEAAVQYGAKVAEEFVLAEEKRIASKKSDQERIFIKNCTYNIMEEYLSKIVASDATLKIQEERRDISALIRFKISNNTPFTLPEISVAAIIYDETGQSVLIKNYGFRQSFASGSSYWREISLRGGDDILTAQKVASGEYTLSVVPISYDGGDLPDMEAIAREVKYEGAKCLYRGRTILPTVDSRIAEKFSGTPRNQEKEEKRREVHLRAMREAAHKEAANILQGVHIFCNVKKMPEERQGAILEISVENQTTKPIDGVEFNLVFSEAGAIVQEVSATTSEQVAPGQTKISRLNIYDRWMEPLLPALLSGAGSVEAQVKAVTLDGRSIDATGRSLLPYTFQVDVPKMIKY